jgi:two-component system NtrC family sensor kinase
MNLFPFLPVILMDMAGSSLMIVLSVMCVQLSRRLRRRDTGNILWNFLQWVSYALMVFAVSRSAGHILKQVLVLESHEHIWQKISPFSGAINTVTFIVVGSFTLFFERTWNIYQNIARDKQALISAHAELLYLNQNLEKLAEIRTRELVHSEQKYRRIFEVSKDTILVTKKNGLILNLNPSGHNMLGLDKNREDEAQHERYFQNWLAKDADWKKLSQTIAEEGFIEGEELDLRIRNGQLKKVLLSAGVSEASAEDEETIHFLIKDIERQHQMKEQMMQADKLASIGELSSGIAHEINNPLNVILGYTQLLLRNEVKASDRHADLKTIEKHVRNCKSIVEDLLSFARKSKTKKDRVHIESIIENVIKFVHQHSNFEDIRMESSYDRNIPPMMLDEKKIKQVLINLLMNAIHAVERKGCIRISTELDRDSDKMFIRISDDGYGIEKNNISKIFDPFFTTKPTGEGTGLGLSVSYGIIKDHGGDIRVDSEPGKGSIFTIMMPMGGRTKGVS